MSEATGYMTEERIAFREQARDFTDKEVLPVANRLDPVKGDIPRELIDKMGEMGYFGITIPEEFGGLGLGSTWGPLRCPSPRPARTSAALPAARAAMAMNG